MTVGTWSMVIELISFIKTRNNPAFRPFDLRGNGQPLGAQMLRQPIHIAPMFTPILKCPLLSVLNHIFHGFNVYASLIFSPDCGGTM